MHLHRIRILFIFILMGLTACSVYQSSGRKSFESKAPDQIQRASSIDHSTEKIETCWSQPASEPLWHVDTKSALTVTQLEEDEIQVCFPEAL